MASLFARAHRRFLRQLSLPHALTVTRIDVGTTRFTVPVIDKQFCVSTEPWMQDLLSVLLSIAPGTFLDVGVNLGQTLLAVKAISPERRYIGIEPNPKCVSYCEKLVELSNLSDVTLVPAALSNRHGLAHLQLFYGSGTDPSASIVSGFRPEQPVATQKPVACLVFDEIADKLALKDLSVVKIDVEGGELDVLASMERTIGRFRPWIAIEILPCYSAANAARLERQEALEALLQRLGYRMARVCKSQTNHLAGLQMVQRIGVHGDVAMSDYVCCPYEAWPIDAMKVKLKPA